MKTPLAVLANTRQRSSLWRSLVRQPVSFLAAVQFLTRIPVPSRCFPTSEADSAVLLRSSVVYFPLVGALIGMVTASVILGAQQLWSIALAVLVALACEMILTGALHEDAVADFCDAFGGGWSRDDVLRILKDSRVGSFGATGLSMAILLRTAGLVALEPDQLLPATLASATLGRWVILLVMKLLAPIPNRASLARELGERLTWKELLIGSLLTVPGVVLWALVSPYRIAVALAALLFFVLLFVAYLRRRLGGVTGDCLGCACYLAQIIVLFAASAKAP